MQASVACHHGLSQSQPSNIIYTNYDGPGSPMLYNNFPVHRPSDARESLILELDQMILDWTR